MVAPFFLLANAYRPHAGERSRHFHIERFYNPTRWHFTLDLVRPDEFEKACKSLG